MSDLKPTDLTRINAADNTSAAVEPANPISIRVSPHSYFTALFLGTFLAALLFYLEIDIAGFAAFGISWIVLPFLALRDRISFDGKGLQRTGLLPQLWSWFNGSRRRLKITDIEQVETQSIRALKRGGSVHYRYRTILRGKGLSIAIASGGEDFRRMIKGILPKLEANALDVRSLELREFLSDPKETLMKAEFSRIPSADALESSISDFLTNKHRQKNGVALGDDEKVEDLRVLGNELRVSGYLPQALEAFRRALKIRGADGLLLFEFARCLHAFAGVKRDPRLERKALAALRLSERHVTDDGDLLSRLGEYYFSLGETRRAEIIFQRVFDHIGENFRAARGLAEMSLRDGKIAHVIHQFSTANRLATTPSLRRWTRAEADYFSSLNSDEEYMELEIGRVNMLETIERSKHTTLKITFLSFPLIAAGLFFEDSLVANIGWAASTVSLLIWTGLNISSRMLSHRIPYDLVESGD
ncbi:MAG TPA: tetratricopeptide repeat protein [Pyrinomonadaceae bacterium]|nr:tetratricopeptide repeat protein [Pyrinomonadaceae bacterium]